jgi:hypothetical protein
MKYSIYVYGGSCNYWLTCNNSGIGGTMNKAEAYKFDSEYIARTIGQQLFKEGKIGHWQIKIN